MILEQNGKVLKVNTNPLILNRLHLHISTGSKLTFTKLHHHYSSDVDYCLFTLNFQVVGGEAFYLIDEG